MGEIFPELEHLQPFPASRSIVWETMTYQKRFRNAKGFWQNVPFHSPLTEQYLRGGSEMRGDFSKMSCSNSTSGEVQKCMGTLDCFLSKSNSVLLFMQSKHKLVMILKEDQARLKALLTEAVRVILKNGLRFNQEISIQGLLGITLDNNDIFLVNINEIVEHEATQVMTSVGQFSGSNNLQNYLPKLLEHTSMANVLGLPMVESLPSLNINMSDPTGRGAPPKRPAMGLPPRRRGSSPNVSPAHVQTSPFCPGHLSNRLSPAVFRSPPPEPPSRADYEPSPKRVHHDFSFGNHVPIAPFHHNNDSSSVNTVRHETTNHQVRMIVHK